MQKGNASILLDKPVYVEATASVVGQKEGEGPLAEEFDIIENDPMFGVDNWEKAESTLQGKTIDKLFIKSGLKYEDVRYIFAGDLLGQLIASSFGIKKYGIPFFGLYGACSTFGEALSLGAFTVANDGADRVIAMASSHFASAEKQFRFPLEYGNQRPMASTWTVTGCGAVILSKIKSPVKVTGFTTGRIVDYGVKDSMNMGAAMAPAACETIETHFKDFGINPKEYDKIITGDLGTVGSEILTTMLKERGYEISRQHEDCGVKIFDDETQNTGAGGSGCGCSASVLSAYYLPKIASGELKKILFVPTGALLSPVSFNEGQSVPGIAHAVVIEHVEV